MKRKFFILWSAGVFSTIAALPYIFALQRDVIAKLQIPLFQIGIVAVLQTAIYLAIAVFFGLKLSEKINLSPLVLFGPSAFTKESILKIFKLSVPIGVVVALLIKLGDFFFLSRIPQLAIVVEAIPFWKALLVAPYGGVVEELLMRLFCVSLFAWLLSKVFKSREAAKSNAIIWTAIVVSAVLFGLGHLPATATITPITPLVFFRAILLNGIGGLVFGWLYWKKGLEYAIVAHFTTDIVLHAILPMLMK